MRKLTALLTAVVLSIGVALPSTGVNAATTKVRDLYTGKTSAVTVNSQSYVNVCGSKVDMKNIPVFLRSGNYMGGVAKIFKNTPLKVGIKDYKEGKVPCLKLTYGKKVLVIKQGTNKATLNGSSVTLAAVPFRAYYTKSKATRWVVPIKSVCGKLGINYTRSSSGVIKITPAPIVSTPPVVNTPVTDNNDTTIKDNINDTDNDMGEDTPTSSKKKIVITLDPGHGGSDSGAVGNSLKEKNLNLAIVLAAKKYFDANSRFQVYYSRTADTYPSLTARSTLANTKNSDLFISVHINSFTASSKGTETLYNNNRLSTTKKNNITSKVLAQAMQNATLKATGFTNRGIVNRTGLSVLNKTKMPACLIEYGFISNPTEAIQMKNGTSRYGQSLYNAVVQLCKDKGLY